MYFLLKVMKYVFQGILKDSQRLSRRLSNIFQCLSNPPGADSISGATFTTGAGAALCATDLVRTMCAG